MKFLVLGITGRRGSGKDTIANYLKSRHGFRVLTYTNDVLAPELKKMGKEVTRENLIDLALSMRAKGGKFVLTKLICEKIEPKGFWAISGVRYPEEVEYFKTAFGSNFKLVEIACSTRKRFDRVVGRGTKGEGGMTFERFMEIEEKETEKIIGATIKLADFSINNDGTKQEFEKRIDAFAKKIGLSG
jgi:dephospho-CoA kinase